MSKFILRKSLYKISSHLGREELKSIKFLCDEYLPRRKLERLHSAFEVFCALEAGGFIDYGTTEHLEFLLDNIGRKHLLTKYPIESIMSPVYQPLSGNFSREQMLTTRAFLSKLSGSFSEKEFRTLANFFFDPSASALRYDDIECMTSAEDLFLVLLDERVIQPNDLSQLSTVLEIIGRKDLKEKVDIHQQQQQQAIHSNQMINPSPETLHMPQHLPLAPYGRTNSAMFSPNTPCMDCGDESSGQTMSMDHRPRMFFGQADKPQMEQNATIPLNSIMVQNTMIGSPSMEQNETIPPNPIMVQNTVVGSPSTILNGQNAVGASLIAQGQVVRNYRPSLASSSSPSTAIERALQRSKEVEKSLSLQVEQLSESQKQQQEMIRRLVREKKVLEQESYRNPDCYEMNQRPHGLALVIGNENFKPNPKRPGLRFEQRRGCECDIRNYESTFRYLRYKVETYRNLSASEIYGLVNKYATMDHSQYDSFVLCVSSHGEENHFVFGSDTSRVDLEEIICSIQGNPTLFNKPKMFFIQACRTKATDSSEQVHADGNPPQFIYHPDADVFIAFATTPHHSSYRSPDYGAWFVVALATVVIEYANSLDLQSFMTKVNRIVCEAEGHDGTSPVKQCVDINSRLTRAVYFLPSS